MVYKYCIIIIIIVNFNTEQLKMFLLSCTTVTYLCDLVTTIHKPSINYDLRYDVDLTNLDVMYRYDLHYENIKQCCHIA